jgi:hypothetical protein
MEKEIMQMIHFVDMETIIEGGMESKYLQKEFGESWC